MSDYERDGPPKRGFACGDNAANAARKNHELGTAHKFDSDSGRRAAREAIKSPDHPRFTKRRVTEH
jgi:hypothetical protein